MIEIKSPQTNYNNPPTRASVFLAGGITGCQDWQSEALKMLEEDHITVYNPRRKHFSINNMDVCNEQIEWEFENLYKSDIILFWFPKETLCPITLFELGVHSYRAKSGLVDIFVGCDYEYKRKYDVVKQMSLTLPELEVVENLYSLVDRVKGGIYKRRLVV